MQIDRARRRSPQGSIRWVLVIVAVTVAIFPYVWMIRTSLTPDAFAAGLSPIPTRINLSAYVRAWTVGGMGPAVLNGVIVSASVLFIQLLTSVPAAFAFAKLRFRGRNVLYVMILAALLIPGQAIAIPLFLGMSYANLANTYLGLILPSTTTAFGLFLLRQYMVSLPDGLIDAARMDGFSYPQILLRVVVPLSKPAIVTFALFSVFGSWNEYFWPLLIARDPGLRTPPLALAVFQNSDAGFDYSALAAGAVIVTLPIIVLFLIARRNFVSGITGNEIVG
jgi:multiple sugar transport system permease protein